MKVKMEHSPSNQVADGADRRRTGAIIRLAAFVRAQPLAGILWIGTLLALPILVHHLTSGEFDRAAALAFVLVLGADTAMALGAGRPPRAAQPLYLALTAALLGFVAHELGVVGALWCFPLLLLAHQLAASRHAVMFDALLLTLVPTVIGLQGDPWVAVRLAMALAVTIGCILLGERIVARERERWRDEQERLELLVRCTKAGSVEWDAASNRTEYSRRFVQMLGYAGETDTSGWKFFDLVDDDDRPRVRDNFLRQIRNCYQPHAMVRLEPHDYRLIRADGSRISVHSEALLIADGRGWVRRYLCSFNDVSRVRLAEVRLRDALIELSAERAELLARQAELEQSRRELETANRRLAMLSQTDPLTGLANRRGFEFEIESACRQAQAHGHAVALLMIDVDHFKTYNDGFGHDQGDAALRRVAALLRSEVGESATTARYGGEEFAVVLCGVDLEQAAYVAEGLRAKIAQAHWPLRPMTVSIGLASCRPAADADVTLVPGSLLQAADRALYEAKAAGRNRVVCAERDCLQDVHNTEPRATRRSMPAFADTVVTIGEE
jgi:diguanylate cyclase (GGDEF)-like protein/PAS domain S-box-containing protein